MTAANNHTYFKLTYTQTDENHNVGEGLAASEQTIRIGQRDDCDIVFPNKTPYADELYAIIKRNLLGEGWILVPTSDFEDAKVNDLPVSVVHYLKDHDTISFGNEEQGLLFEICTDAEFDVSAKTIAIRPAKSTKSIKVILSCIVISIILLLVLAGKTFAYINQEKTRNIVIDTAKSSVFQIGVDSVYYICSIAGVDSIVDSFSYVVSEGSEKIGTVFLTTDSTFFTARHCIEPWLNDQEPLQNEDPLRLSSIPTRWALFAETYNQTHDNDTVYKVVGICTLYENNDSLEKNKVRMLSSAFAFETSHDEILEIGDFSHAYYWRSITPRNSFHDMMLDDIAYAKTFQAGTIVRASASQIEKLLKIGTRLDFLGFPQYIYSGMETTDGLVKRKYSKGEMIAHDGKLAPGYSGGPALIIDQKQAFAVGVVSVVDNQNGGIGFRSYSVPISESQVKGGRP